MTDSLAVPTAPEGLELLERRLEEMEHDPKANRPTVSKIRSIVEKEKAKRALVSPPGALKLPPLLEQRRLQFGITDGAFAFQPAFDRVLVHQLAQVPGLTHVPGGVIHKVDNAEVRELESSPQGVVVAAGLGALDALRSNGIDLGDIVDFAYHAPLRKRVDKTERGDDVWVILLQAGDIVGSADLAERIQQGEARIEFDAENYQHHFVGADGKKWKPIKPWVREDW